MGLINPSGILCAACQKEIDLFDGPVRKIGKPTQFPFCWKCWQDFYRSDYIPRNDIAVKNNKQELHIWLEKRRDK